MLETSPISFAYRDTYLLKSIEISIKKGELLVVVGPNGAGKSTLLSLLARENKPQEGEIKFKGKPLDDWDALALARHKAKFSQEHNPRIGLLVKDIVLMGRYPYFGSVPSEEDITIVDEMMQKTDVFTLKNRSYNSLSGGEKQRVHLARILAQLQNNISGKLAFFDEPLNNLDVRHQHHILEEIKTFVKQGNSALVVLHDLNLAAEFADKVLLMKKGEIAAYGNPEAIFTVEIIKRAYDFPCAVCPNPITKKPLIVFGKKIPKSVLNP